MSTRSEALAVRLEAGAAALAEFAAGLTAAQWAAPTPKDGRQVGVIIHHVASVYPLEIQLAQVLAAGNAIEGVTWDAVAAMNSGHAAENAAVSVEDALALLKANSAASCGVMGGPFGSATGATLDPALLLTALDSTARSSTCTS